MDGKKMSRKIVIAMDGSNTSTKALDFYMKYVYRDNDEVILVHCVQHKARFFFGSNLNPKTASEKFQEEDKAGLEICEKLESRIAEIQMGKQMSVTKIHGDSGPSIIQKANECRASIIIVGSRGLGTIRRTILGSVSDYILHHADVPVLICPQ